MQVPSTQFDQLGLTHSQKDLETPFPVSFKIKLSLIINRIKVQDVSSQDFYFRG